MTKGYLVLLLAAFLAVTLTKPIVPGKVILALNCGTKDEVVDSYDKAFKYQGVHTLSCRTSHTLAANQCQSITTPTTLPKKPTSCKHFMTQVHLRQETLHVRATYLRRDDLHPSC